MRIRMNTLSAGPTGVLLAGQEYEIPEAEARQLVTGGYATAVKPPPETAKVPAPASSPAAGPATAKNPPADTAGAKPAGGNPAKRGTGAAGGAGGKGKK